MRAFLNLLLTLHYLNIIFLEILEKERYRLQELGRRVYHAYEGFRQEVPDVEDKYDVMVLIKTKFRGHLKALRRVLDSPPIKPSRDRIRDTATQVVSHWGYYDNQSVPGHREWVEDVFTWFSLPTSDPRAAWKDDEWLQIKEKVCQSIYSIFQTIDFRKWKKLPTTYFSNQKRYMREEAKIAACAEKITHSMLANIKWAEEKTDTKLTLVK